MDSAVSLLRRAVDPALSATYKSASSFPHHLMSTTSVESPSAIVLPPVQFPRTWGELQDVLDIVGLNGAYGDRRILLMQEQNGDYSRLRQEESDLIMRIGRHEPGELFNGPRDVACLRTVLDILSVPIVSPPSKPEGVSSRAEAFRKGIDNLFGLR